MCRSEYPEPFCMRAHITKAEISRTQLQIHLKLFCFCISRRELADVAAEKRFILKLKHLLSHPDITVRLCSHVIRDALHIRSRSSGSLHYSRIRSQVCDMRRSAAGIQMVYVALASRIWIRRKYKIGPALTDSHGDPLLHLLIVVEPAVTQVKKTNVAHPQTLSGSQ